ncbi:hypothetical protein BGZ46_005591, partial [Entomortierella lignicola]
SRKSYRTISNAMEFLDVFHSRASGIHGANFLAVCSRLLLLAILDDAERQRVENALMLIPSVERTWDVCEQTFIHELKTAHQRTHEVIKAVKAGMTKGESYKRYAWRLERINRIYKISGSASEDQVVSLLELSIPASALAQLHMHLTIAYSIKAGELSFRRVSTIQDFCQSLVILEGPEDCDDRRHNRDHADLDNDDGDRPNKRAKTRHDTKDATSGKSGSSFFCRNGCGSNRTHNTEGCIICGNCKARGHFADKCPKETKTTTSPSLPTANQRQGNNSSFNARGRHQGGKPYQRGYNANAQNSNSQGTLSDSTSFICSESSNKTFTDSAILLNTTQTEPSVTVCQDDNNNYFNKLKGNRPIVSLSTAIDSTNAAAADSSPHLNSSPITYAAANVHPLHTASDDALHFPHVE